MAYICQYKIFSSKMNKFTAKRIFTNVVLLGLVSFFADISSEMVYPVIPLYLVSALGATPALIGVIEGIAESLASLLKVFSGNFSDKYSKKKLLAFSGYATGLIYKVMLLLATSWNGILAARIVDRIGKGIRTAPRDVMINESAEKNHIGKAFGIHKMLDMAGSSIGIALAYLILNHTAVITTGSYKHVFAWSIVPVIFALLMFFFIKEKKRTVTTRQNESFWKNIKLLDKNLILYLAVALFFTLGNSSNAFLLLRAHDVGFSNKAVILLYLIYNVTAAIFSIPFGNRSDKKGRKPVLVTGYLLFSLVYFGFAFATKQFTIITIFILYGFYTAMTAGVERAFISEIAPQNLKGTMLGLHATIVGLALLPASTIAGLLWTHTNSKAPFIFGASMALISALILLCFLHPKSSTSDATI